MHGSKCNSFAVFGSKKKKKKFVLQVRQIQVIESTFTTDCLNYMFLYFYKNIPIIIPFAIYKVNATLLDHDVVTWLSASLNLTAACPKIQAGVRDSLLTHACVRTAA